MGNVIDFKPHQYVQANPSQANKKHVLLIAGAGMPAPMWPFTLPGLDTHIHTHPVALFGLSGTPNAQGPTSQLPDILAKYYADDMERKGIARYSVLGYSAGGVVAQAMAQTYPERIERVMLIATPLSKVSMQQRASHAMLKAMTQTYLMPTEIWHQWQQAMGQFTVNPWQGLQSLYAISQRPVLLDIALRTLVHPQFVQQAYPDYRRLLYLMTQGMSQTGHQYAHHTALCDAETRLHHLRHLPMPVDLFYGDSDPLLPACDVATMRSQLPRMTTHSIHQAGHFPLIEQRQTVAKIAQSLSQ